MSKITPCAHPGCKEEGTFPAPCDPRNPAARQYFCAAHIKEFNKSWNGLAGFSEDEIFAMQHGAATWNRPTWKLGVNGDAATAAKIRFNSAEELFAYFKQRSINGAKVKNKQTSTPNRVIPPDVREACVIFSLEKPDICAERLKRRYLMLVKKYHPDVNPHMQQADDMVKRINVAYRILQDYGRQQPVAV